tara:strand:- start:1257 stop:1892 length:636 start_codon:yes stop_codon:yes gene_type:complete
MASASFISTNDLSAIQNPFLKELCHKTLLSVRNISLYTVIEFVLEKYVRGDILPSDMYYLFRDIRQVHSKLALKLNDREARDASIVSFWAFDYAMKAVLSPSGETFACNVDISHIIEHLLEYAFPMIPIANICVPTTFSEPSNLPGSTFGICPDNEEEEEERDVVFSTTSSVYEYNGDQPVDIPTLPLSIAEYLERDEYELEPDVRRHLMF